MRNVFTNYMTDEILPSIRDALKKEDKHFRKQFKNSTHNDFYNENIKGIASYILTERTLQYLIFRELCKSYKVLPEDLAYVDSNKRLDISIYKNIKDPSKFAEIGIELKQVGFTKKDRLYKTSLNNLVSDFDKIKRVQNKNKYLIIMGLHNKKNIDLDLFNEYLRESIDNRKFRKFRLDAISSTYFKTDLYKGKEFYLIVLLRVE